MRRRSEKGFTLMELMVVIVIVAILAAVAVPLYINYVRDAQRTEAKGAIGAIVTAEQVYFQQYQTYADLDVLREQGKVDLSEVENKWSFTMESATATGFVVKAENATDNLCVRYTHDRETQLTPQQIWDDNCTLSGP